MGGRLVSMLDQLDVDLNPDTEVAREVFEENPKTVYRRLPAPHDS